jgi:hypothetical protein
VPIVAFAGASPGSASECTLSASRAIAARITGARKLAFRRRNLQRRGGTHAPRAPAGGWGVRRVRADGFVGGGNFSGGSIRYDSGPVGPRTPLSPMAGTRI